MSTELSGDSEQVLGTPELAPIGKRIEMLRIERGLSKQQLAKGAGISRQQLWRVLAGKSDLTSSLRERLAFVLRTEISVLQPDPDGEAARPLATWFGRSAAAELSNEAAASATTTLANTAPATFAEFVSSPTYVQVLLAALPGCESGLALKRAVLDSIEDVAMARGIALPDAFFALRRAVITREL